MQASQPCEQATVLDWDLGIGHLSLQEDGDSCGFSQYMKVRFVHFSSDGGLLNVLGLAQWFSKVQVPNSCVL